MRQLLIPLLLFTCAISAQTKKVIANLPPELVKELAVSVPNVRIVSARGPELAKEIVDADALVGIPLTRALFKQARQLKWYHVGSAGVENALFPELVRRMPGVFVSAVNLRAWRL